MSNYFNFFITRFGQKADKEKAINSGLTLIRDDKDISSDVKILISKISICDLEFAYDLAASRASNNIKLIQELDHSIAQEQKKIAALDPKHIEKEEPKQAVKNATAVDTNMGTVITEDIAVLYDPHKNLRRLQLLKTIISAAQLFERACETNFHRRRANKFFFSQFKILSQAFANGDMQYTRNLVVETLCSLKLLKKSADDNLPSLRSYLRCIHALEETMQEYEQSKEKKSLSLRRACRVMTKPIAFPDWVHKTPCQCAKEKTSVDAGLVQNSAKDQLAGVKNYVQDLNTALQNCKKGNESTNCECHCNDCCIPQNPCAIDIKSYVMDLMVVTENLENYEAGEIAHIQNVMAGETIERTHEVVKETEDYSESESTISREDENEFSKSERFEMQDAVQKTVAQDLSADAGITASGTYGPAGSYTATANVAYSRSTSQAQQTARNYAKEISERSLLRIQEETRHLSTRRVMQRISETNFHKFEGADQHIIGQYYWVNKRTVSQVMNWGKRVIYEFVIPEPASLYKSLLEKSQSLI